MSRKKYVIKATTYDKRDRIISVGHNNYTKSHPLMAHFGKLVGLPEKIYLHAEVDALIRAGDKVPHSIVIERYNAEGLPELAKPCPVCDAAIKAWGVKYVFWTKGVDFEINA
jgi:tRNA(Arg) A34 adenosine deaminase TadA